MKHITLIYLGILLNLFTSSICRADIVTEYQIMYQNKVMQDEIYLDNHVYDEKVAKDMIEKCTVLKKYFTKRYNWCSEDSTASYILKRLYRNHSELRPSIDTYKNEIPKYQGIHYSIRN